MGSPVHVHRVNANRPVINGVSFDDTYDMRLDQARMLCYRGLLFATEFTWTDHDGTVQTFGGVIAARSMQDAQEVAKGRRLNEKVIGELADIDAS